MNRRHFLLAVVTAAFTIIRAHADDVPAPADTPCKVIVHGRTSTLDNIVVKKVGQNIPKIYHGQHACKNTPDFDWYVSQHYALKCNVGDDLAREYLTLAELAHPHYVEVIGGEPLDLDDTRLAFVHATDLETLQKAVTGDIGTHWAGDGGAVTLPHSFASYIYPSGTLRYHRNDLTIHECLHLQQLTVTGGFYTPVRYTEGIAYAFANHVYDPAKKQLTVAVFDKAPINNPMDSSLRAMRKKGIPSIETMMREKGDFGNEGRGLLTAFYWSDPERLMKWRLWRDELFRAGNDDKGRELDIELMKQLHGGTLERLDADWHDWVNARHTTFTHVDWGWEQWGDTLQSYGWPWDKSYFAQMDINLPPGKKLKADALRLDYPREPRPAIIGAVELGGDEPTVGCVLDFSQAENTSGKPAGWAGLGLGVDGRKLLRVVVEENKQLVIDGKPLGLASGVKTNVFPAEVLEAARKQKRIGLTIKVGKDAVIVTVRAGAGSAIQEMEASYPVSADERKGLLERHMAAISRDARHLITPHFDKIATEDLSKPAPANRWLFAGDQETYRLYRAAWRLGEKAPKSLTSLRDEMLAAFDKGEENQKAAMAAYQSRIEKVIGDITGSGAKDAASVLGELSGASLRLKLSPEGSSGKPRLTVVIEGTPDSKLAGTVTLAADAEGAIAVPAQPEKIEIEAGRSAATSWVLKLPPEKGTAKLTVTARLKWHGADIELTANRKVRYELTWTAEP
jgi:hypothetical protein